MDDRAQAMERRLEAPIIVATLLMVRVLLPHGGVLFDGPLHRRGGRIEFELMSGAAALVFHR